MSEPPTRLDYSRPGVRPSLRVAKAIAFGAVALAAGAIAAWHTAHTIWVVGESRRLADARPIDIDPTWFGMALERAIPLGVFAGGVALVAIVRLARAWNARQA